MARRKAGDIFGSPDTATPMGNSLMAGKFEVDDTPETNNEFMNRYTSQNASIQKAADDAYQMSGNFDYRGMADSSRAFSPKAMQERIDRAPQDDYDRSLISMSDLYGDYHNTNFRPGPFVLPGKEKPIESGVKDIYDDFGEQIKK